MVSEHLAQIAVRVVFACLFGTMVGLEREWSDHRAGLRTHILVTVGACVFTTVSIFGFAGSSDDRVAAGVVAGIGFIGAGTILRGARRSVSGLTTAASLWSCAAIGMLCGAGMIVESLVVTALDLVILGPLEFLAERILNRTKKLRLTLKLTGKYREGLLEQVRGFLSENCCHPRLITFQRLEDGEATEIAFGTKVPSSLDLEELTETLCRIPEINGALWE